MADDIHDFFGADDAWDDHEPAVAGAPPAPPRSRRDMRRKRKRRQRRRLIAVIAVLVTLALLAVAGFYGYRAIRAWRSSNLSDSSAVADYPGPGEGSVSFTVVSGEGAIEIGRNLVEQDVIKSADAFTSVVAANEMTLYPGTYELKRHMKASQAARILADQGNAKGFLEVRQGERLDDVLKNAAAATDIDVKQFQAITGDKAKADAILPSEANGCFEGWLEPGVYDVASRPDAASILKQMVEARIAKLDELGVPQGAQRERILIIASIVEAEVNSPDYYGKVSRVILNRLDQNMTLGMDSTVAYGFKTQGTQLTNDQLNDGSNPYNTRVNKGLPPTPISNPGDDAIEAALHPENGDWLYFVTTNLKTGETKFTADYDQFEQYVQEYKTGNANAN